eukprot:11373761-Karenia_brevis.AAC.1
MGCVNRGVIQGCPTASLLFVLGADPFVTLFDRYVNSPSLGVVRFCADDCGAVLRDWQHLLVLFEIFDRAARASGLILSSSKCKLVPLSSRSFDEVSLDLRAWLLGHVPGWSDFGVCQHA